MPNSRKMDGTGRIGATEYAEGNGTRKRGGDAERITQG